MRVYDTHSIVLWLVFRPFPATDIPSLHQSQTSRRDSVSRRRLSFVDRRLQTAIPNSRSPRTTAQRSFIPFSHCFGFNHNRLRKQRPNFSVIMELDCLHNGTVISSRNQNGSCSSNGVSVPPLKWKPRKVSAVRDFPRGCGPIVQIINVDSQEANPTSSLVNNNNEPNGATTTETQVESLPNDVSKSTEGVKVESIMESHKELQKEDNQKESTRKMKFPQRRVSAVREFPPYCGLNATEPSKEERIRINGKRKNGRLTVAVEESNGSFKDESLIENQDPTVDKLDERSHTATEIIQKACQDIVVYTRDSDSNKRSSIDAYDDDDSEGNIQEDSSHDSDTHVEPIKSLPPKNSNGQTKKVSHKKNPKKRSLDDTSSPQFIKGDRIIVLGLMAPSLSPIVTPSTTAKKSNPKKVKAPKESNSIANETYTDTLDMVVSNDQTPKESKSKKVKVPKESNSEEVKVPKESNSNANETYTGMLDMVVSNDQTPKKSKSKKDKVPMETKSKEVKVPKESKSKKVKVSKESNSNVNETYTGTLDMVVSNDQTPKKSKSKKVKVPKESNSKKVKVSKESKSKKVKVEKEPNSNVNKSCTGRLDMVVKNEEDFVQKNEKQEEIPNSHEAHEVDVTLPPFGPRSSNSARNRIRETLRLFQTLCRKLLQGEEAKTSEDDESNHVLTGKRVDLTARKILQEKGKAPDRGKKDYGSIPGIEVGDEFQYRVELALIGLHWLLQGGIDYVKHGKKKTPVAVSVVASGGYDNEIDKPECLIYSGSGGIGKDKHIEDQKLERGNVALKNNIDLKIPVRVIRGYKGKSAEPQSKSLTTYIYDGLYTVEKYWQETGKHGNLVFKFELKRIPGQPELALREVKSKNFKTREGLCVKDITNGKEKIRIPAVNTIDDEKPPNFTYITKIVYPDGYGQRAATGCDCVGRCSGKRCKCAAKNGGELPYNHNGAIVEAKPLVYECGPACKCGPSCYNRVTQNGMKIQLEIFKTETRGWGVRSISSISSGSFICEYVGELLEDTEAEKRTSNDEYLFDIGQNYSDTGMGTGTDDPGTGGFTIDAANYGNVGRFINHSCSPNLYAQNVLYDQEDKRMPHIMLFAAENIPPLTELTYHYNYAVDTVHDSEGNIKVKKCYCGSSECTGRLY